MSTTSRAVFLSYASEDAPAAQRIAEALRAAGIEVWFDREELRGGDAIPEKIAALVVHGTVEEIANCVRLPSGELQDDVAVVVVAG